MSSYSAPSPQECQLFVWNVSTSWCREVSGPRTLLWGRALRWAVSIRAAGRRCFIELLLCGILLLWAFALLDLLFTFCATDSPLDRDKTKSDLPPLKSRLEQNWPIRLNCINTGRYWNAACKTVKARTSSSLSDVSESVEAAGLLTGSSCSPESTRFLFARDKSS